jgi:hypothetical protein
MLSTIAIDIECRDRNEQCESRRGGYHLPAGKCRWQDFSQEIPLIACGRNTRSGYARAQSEFEICRDLDARLRAEQPEERSGFARITEAIRAIVQVRRDGAAVQTVARGGVNLLSDLFAIYDHR